MAKRRYIKKDQRDDIRQSRQQRLEALQKGKVSPKCPLAYVYSLDDLQSTV